MNKNSLFRKIAYVAAIVLLLGPLFAMGRPKSGMIGQLRSKYKMGESNLGELDPTSESMRLGTLGMKGIAATILWIRADYYKEEKYFDRFSATLNQISKLQPHFISVWQHQAHNLSYNVAPEFEDYRQRYEWIKKGVDYLIRGTKVNDRKPILQYDLGHYLGNKLGKADEHVYYRVLYSKDQEFHTYFRDQGLVGIETTALDYNQKPDNWLTGKLWFDQAVALYEAGAAIKKSPHLLMSYSPLWQMYYGEAIESEGILDQRAGFAWKQGGTEWANFGTKSLYQFRQVADLTLLSRKETYAEMETLQKQFDELAVDAKPKADQLIRKGVPADMLKRLEIPEQERSDEDRTFIADLERKLVPNMQQIAAQLPPSTQLQGLEIARKLLFLKDFVREIDSYRSQVNYDYWETRAKAEQREDMLEARSMTFQADQMINEARVAEAIEAYEKAWKLWRKIFNRFPSMMDQEVGDDVVKSVGRYKRLMDEELDDKFILHDFLEFRKANDDPALGREIYFKKEEMNARARALLEAESRGETVVEPEPDVPSKEAPQAEAPAKPVEPTPAKVEEMKPEQAKSEPAKPEPGKPEEPAAEVKAAVQKEELPIRPPTLENPDSQN
jgi:hypothetical protein